jgi:hypothetical protein
MKALILYFEYRLIMGRVYSNPEMSLKESAVKR